MEPKRTLHSGNLVRGICAGVFMEKYYDLKSLTEEEIAWLEEHFMDFAREQYLVRWDDMREALKIVQRQKELQRQN